MISNSPPLFLARRARQVLGVEGDALLVSKALANAARNGIGNARFAVQNLFEPKSFGAWADERYDLVLLGIGGPVGSCIFPAIQAVWRGMRGFWSPNTVSR